MLGRPKRRRFRPTVPAAQQAVSLCLASATALGGTRHTSLRRRDLVACPSNHRRLSLKHSLSNSNLIGLTLLLVKAVISPSLSQDVPTYRCCASVVRFPFMSYWGFHVFAIPRHIGDRGQFLSTLPARRVWGWGPFFLRQHRRVERALRGRAAAGGAVALGRAVPKRGMLKQA